MRMARTGMAIDINYNQEQDNQGHHGNHSTNQLDYDKPTNTTTMRTLICKNVICPWATYLAVPRCPSASPEQVIHAVSTPMKKAFERISVAARKLKYLRNHQQKR